MYLETHHRQSEFLPENSLTRPIIVLGAGGAGSPLAWQLMKMGIPNVTVIDFDNVEIHNTGAQMYLLEHNGQPKVNALENMLADTPDSWHFINGKAPDDLPTITEPTIVISGLDSMGERLKIWEWVKVQPMISYYIDGRMGLEKIRVYTVDMLNPDHTILYEQNLYPESEAEHLACSSRQVAYNGAFIASVMASQVSKIVRNTLAPFEILGDLELSGLTVTIRGDQPLNNHNEQEASQPI